MTDKITYEELKAFIKKNNIEVEDQKKETLQKAYDNYMSIPSIQPEAEEKKLDTKEDKSTVDSVDEQTYTTSPDGKYKIPISEFDSDRLEENKINIPQIKIPGWVVSWPHDIKASSIPYMVGQGWIFVSPTEPNCEAAGRKVVAGTTQAKETAFHYAMKMPESKFRELRAREEKQRQDLLEVIKKTPSEESKAIYATDEMKINRGLSK